jgi:hypothetical protein
VGSGKVNVRGVASRMPLRLKSRGYSMAMDQLGASMAKVQ